MRKFAITGFVGAVTLASFGLGVTPALAQTYYAVDNDVVCDGSDDTVDIQKFLKRINRPGRAGIFPAGVCGFSSPLVFPANETTVLGAGQWATTFNYMGNGKTQNLIIIDHDYNEHSGDGPATIGGFRVTSDTDMISGAAIYVENINFLNLEEIAIGANDGDTEVNRFFTGIELNKFDFVRINGVFIEASDVGLKAYAEGPGAGHRQFDLFVSDGKIERARIGVHIAGGLDNLYFSNMMITHNQDNVLIDSSVGYGNQEITFSDTVVIDQASRYNVVINDPLANSLKYCNIALNGRITGAESHGIVVDRWGVGSDDGCQISINSPLISNNGQGPGGGNGIQINDANPYILIGSGTAITQNSPSSGTGFGIASSVLTNRVISSGLVRANGAAGTNQYNSNLISNYALDAGTTLSVPATPQPLLLGSAYASGAGNNSATATVLTAEFNYINTYGPGAEGVRMPGVVGSEIVISNTTGLVGPISVYPPTGAQFGGAGANNPVNLSPGQTMRVTCLSASQCFVN